MATILYYLRPHNLQLQYRNNFNLKSPSHQSASVIFSQHSRFREGELGAAALAQRNHTRIRDLLAHFEIQTGELRAAALDTAPSTHIRELLAKGQIDLLC